MPVVEVTEVVDARGLSRAAAIAMTARVVERLDDGTVFEIFATDAGLIDDVALWCRSTGDQLLCQTSDGKVLSFVLRRRRVWAEGPRSEVLTAARAS
jgi:tRNA 2-thiouridine synthesizing protein A